MDYCWIYTTCETEQDAVALAHALVEDSLVACANLLPTIRSIYRWQGKTCDGAECALLLKTTARRYEAAKARVVALHRYEMPCIIRIDWHDVDDRFADWIDKQTGA